METGRKKMKIRRHALAKGCGEDVFKITEISYDGIHWFKAETEGGCIVEADGIVVTNPMKDVRTKTLSTKKVFGSSV